MVKAKQAVALEPDLAGTVMAASMVQVRAEVQMVARLVAGLVALVGGLAAGLVVLMEVHKGHMRPCMF